jgi:methylglutaconyl-CoA hydratase
MYQHLESVRTGAVERLTLNRPDVRNAFNEQVIAELTQWASTVAGDSGVRAVVLSGAGKVFCAASRSFSSRV